MVVGREVLLGNGYADLIAVEPSGRLAVIEVKLAKSAEARRSIVAQVLTYAAHLNGLDPAGLERDILAPHLKQRGYESLGNAVESNDQEGLFDHETFSQGLSSCLAQGRFRLVLALDEAPEELVRLVGYLEAVTEDRLLIDLITMSLYRIGETEVIIPQKVEPDRPSTDSQHDRLTVAQTKSRLVEGVADFDGSIANSPKEQRPELQRLRDWGVSLNEQKLCRVQTVHSKFPNQTVLLLRLLDEKAGLATIYNNGGAPALQLWSTVIRRRAPKSFPKIEQILMPESVGQGTYVKKITDELLKTLADAYREASGQDGS